MCLVTAKCFFLSIYFIHYFLCAWLLRSVFFFFVSISFTIFYVLGYCEVFLFLSVYFIHYFLYAWLLRSVFF